jgi:type 1 glutamine amidotransferase
MKKVLMVMHSAGFKHDYLPKAIEIITELGKKSGQFEVTVTTECNLLNKESLKKFDALIFATTGELPITNQQKDDLLSAIKAGKPFIGIHNATDTFYKLPEYGRMIGGYFNGHPWSQDVWVKVEDQTHPSTMHLPRSFRVKEEVYTFRDWSREKTHVLVSLDNNSVDLSKGNRGDNDYAMCWWHTYGKAQVFYTAFGHYLETWDQEWFQTHLLNGILWAMKLTD